MFKADKGLGSGRKSLHSLEYKIVLILQPVNTGIKTTLLQRWNNAAYVNAEFCINVF